MSEEDLRTSQHDEVEAIRAMYPGDIEVLGEDNLHSPPQFIISLYPQRGSSSGGGGDHHVTYVKLHVKYPPMYPKVMPKMTVKESKGLSAQEVEELGTEMKKKAEENLGEVMMYQVLQAAEEFLYAHQKKPTGSFHDEMLMRNKLLQERTLQLQQMSKEKERLAIKEEILRKQEELKEENRRRKELWKTQNDPSPLMESAESSPTKCDQLLSGALKTTVGIGRRKRRSISRRRRSNSEGSDSSLSESSDLVSIEFISGKGATVQQFYRGEVLGRGSHGSTVYAGISKNGSLVAIYEWKFCVAVNRKGKPISNGGDFSTTEEVIKHLQSFETESNFMQKLEHSNTTLYYGMKIHQSSEEAGVVYLYSVQEFLRGNSIRSYLQDPHQLCSMALPLLRHVTQGVVEALKFLHDNNVAHRFLRDTSIFLDVGDVVKLCDYGIERKVYDLFKQVNHVPDVEENFPPSVGRGGKKGDVYRLGLIILSLLKGRYVEGPDIPQTIPAELQDFLKKCLSTLENNRWTAAELLEHPFLKMNIKKYPNLQMQGLAASPHPLKDDEISNDEENEGADAVLPQSQRITSFPVSGCSRLENEFQVLEWLGKGGFGDVLKVQNKLDSRIYALKKIRLNPRNKQLNKKITREVKLLSQLNHENVVRYFNSWIETVEEMEGDDTSTDQTTISTNDDVVIPPKKPIKTKEPSVRFKLDEKLHQNSLGLDDNIEDLAPPVGDSDWSISIAEEREDDGDESEDSSDDVDLFGTSFLRLTNNDSDGVIFESDDCSGRNGNGGTSETDTTGEESSRSKRFTKEPSHTSHKEASTKLPEELPESRKIQYMYIQMEFCEKSTLRTAIDDNLYEDVDRAWRLFREIVEGLVHIHQQGMIHRDLKPVNIFLDSHDHVKIGDFGLATSSILPKMTSGEVDKIEGPQSVDFPEESQTGQVGTALYVAPELIAKATKVAYNQKVDIYSLGIIFFEMFHRPLPTAMERVRVISALRLPSITLPSDFDEHLMPQVTHIIRWLLDHNPTRRPTSLELLQSDYLPPPHLEEAELRDIFSRTLKNSQSKAYKFLIASCFLQKVSPVENFTFDMENTRFPQKQVFLKCLQFFHKLEGLVQRVFERHGALKVRIPELMPKSHFYDDNDTLVSLMCHSGNIVALAHDLRIPFARYVGRYGITHLKRYSIEKVYREKKVYGLHPRELVECAFDIVDCSRGNLIADAEVLAVALEVIQELPWMRNKVCTIRLGHTKLLEGLLLHHGVDPKFHAPIKNTLAEIKIESSSSKSQIQTFLCGRGLSENFIQMLFSLMDVEGSLPKVSNLLKSITKRKSEAASLIKEGLHELEILTNHIEHLGLKCGVAIVPTMVFGSHIYSGLLFQVVCNLRRRKNKLTAELIAAGGRYDALIENFRSALALESVSALPSKEFTHCGVGISISFDKLVAGFDGEDCSQWQRRGTVDAVICSVGHHPLAKEKLEFMKELWTHGIKCTVLECSQTLEAAEEQCKEMGAQYMLILKENEFYSNLRVRIWEKQSFQERKMSRQEAVELISRRVHGYVTNEVLSSGINFISGIHRSESISSKTGNSVGIDSNSSSAQQTNTMALLNISCVVQPEKEKSTNWKKRCENQVMHHITDVLPKLSKQQHVEVLGMDVGSAVVNSLASCLVRTDKDEFYKSLSEVIDKHPRHRKTLKSVGDDVYELWFEKKNASVIILYGLIDNTYRVML